MRREQKAEKRRKERFLRDIKFKLWNNKRYITVTLRGVLERERENKKKNF